MYRSLANKVLADKRSSSSLLDYKNELNQQTESLFRELTNQAIESDVNTDIREISINGYREDGITLFKPMMTKVSEDISEYEYNIDGPDGNSIDMKVFSTKDTGDNAPCLIYYPGGAFVSDLGGVHYGPLSHLANLTDWKIVIPTCRLAPENKLPAGSRDAFHVLQWIYNVGYKKLGIDRSKIALAGDSHGGNFALLTAIKARDQSIPLCFQILISPATDLTRKNIKQFDLEDDLRFKSYEQKDILVSEALVQRVYDWATHDDDDLASPELSPINADLRNIAPPLILTAGNDGLLRDSTRFMDKYDSQNVGAVYVSSKPESFDKFDNILDGTIRGALIIFPGQVHSFFIARNIARKILSGGANPLDLMIRMLSHCSCNDN